MPYREKRRAYDLRAQGERCQTFVYTEKRGWRICGNTKDLQDDHIRGEARLLVEGKDPDNSTGIIRCRSHHIGVGVIIKNGIQRLLHWGEPGWSKHPDIAKANQLYQRGNKNAFKDVNGMHIEKARQGERYVNTTAEIDRFEEAHVRQLEWKHYLRTGEARPTVTPHRKLVKRKKWYDGLF